ncbi:MAG: triose-phosphate isomerase [Omnitrophica bacterium RIFCSPLOWO2_12_FULL_44_17]|uniref:Triosephosphate isomerase n=1 Tax=Candidatus Danuiimicrobium aquiferis TaxID=1801832 RepID=A0A1G1KYH1_9BACT|nr:MAG: triose-phosphate isomerase [Omnitrophica bacterium RIFCSPHIGHO2_02_FULL_45_28]OGW97966.1 MAG: triose-phosphate isomerase [Omnitrophica bacterium RIFCSPLOWO2_12_FULL_44_17]OGX02535.1 MAG: triose-phosphate isomerase [Omnitrophica bacterium RIFCSPLOWO2_02_FULL_44_11]
MKRVLIVGNWKMFKTIPEAVNLVNSIKAGVHKISNCDIVACPPFTALTAVSELVRDSNVDLGAQDMHFETEGAFTGEISPMMLKDVGCRYVILGHSERRAYFKETDELINKKVKAALKYNIVPIVCVGETLEEREAHKAFEVVKKQFDYSLADLDAAAIERVVVAYEPVWAIGTGRTATPEQAEQMHSYIRRLLNEKYGREVAARIKILYGGSVKPDNIELLVSKPNIDGALVGGASIKAESFIQIVKNSLPSEIKSNS